MAILISLLFVLSTFGVGTIMAGIDCCNPVNFHIDKTSVKVGQTFTVFYSFPCRELTDGKDLIEGLLVSVYNADGSLSHSFDPDIGGGDEPCYGCMYGVTYRALKPGKVTFYTGCIENGSNNTESLEDFYDSHCECSKTVTITSRALPMDWIMKKFGLGNKDKE